MGCGALVQKNPPEHPAYLQPKECLEVKGLGFPRKSLVGCSIGTEELIFRTFSCETRY
jgi:hypothetical protein